MTQIMTPDPAACQAPTKRHHFALHFLGSNTPMYCQHKTGTLQMNRASMLSYCDAEINSTYFGTCTLAGTCHSSALLMASPQFYFASSSRQGLLIHKGHSCTLQSQHWQYCKLCAQFTVSIN